MDDHKYGAANTLPERTGRRRRAVRILKNSTQPDPHTLMRQTANEIRHHGPSHVIRHRGSSHETCHHGSLMRSVTTDRLMKHVTTELL